MSKKFQLYITNTQTSPYKIPFKKGTPRELQAKVDGTLKVGKKAIIPSDVSSHVDMERVKGFVKYKIREVLDIPSKAKPIKKKKAKQSVKIKEGGTEIGKKVEEKGGK